MDIQEQSAAVRIVGRMVGRMKITAQLVEIAQVLVVRSAGDDPSGCNRIEVGVGRTQQAFMADGATVRQCDSATG